MARADTSPLDLLAARSNRMGGVCVGSAWKILLVTARPCGANDKQGRARRPGQLLQGAARGAISIKEILGENRGTCI